MLTRILHHLRLIIARFFPFFNRLSVVSRCGSASLGHQNADEDAQQRAGQHLNGRVADQLLEMLVVKIEALARQTFDDVVDDRGVSARRAAHAHAALDDPVDLAVSLVLAPLAASYIVTPAKQNASAKTAEEKPS